MLSEHPRVNVPVQSLHLFNDHTGIRDPVTRKETIQWFRSELERNRDLTDAVSLGYFFLQSGSCNFVVSNRNQSQDDPTRNTAHFTIILWQLIMVKGGLALIQPAPITLFITSSGIPILTFPSLPRWKFSCAMSMT